MKNNNQFLNYLENRDELLEFLNKYLIEDNKFKFKKNRINNLFKKIEKTLIKIKLLDNNEDNNSSYSSVLKFLNKLIKPLRNNFVLTKNKYDFNLNYKDEIILKKDLSLKIDAVLEILNNSKIFPDLAKKVVLISLINFFNSKNYQEQDFYLKEIIFEDELLNDKKTEYIDKHLEQKLKNKQKFLGQVFTPLHIVKDMLDKVNYKGEEIIAKYVLEPSFGDGNFLSVIVERYILSCREKMFSNTQIRNSLNKYVYGVELDPFVFNITKERLNKILNDFGIEAISWDNLYNTNTLYFEPSVRFDFILGNPPYVSCKNLDAKTKKKIGSYKMLTAGSDLYIAFYVKCSELLSKKGLLTFITPNRFIKLKSLSGFRSWLMKENLVKEIHDFKDFQVFSDAVVNTAILTLQKSKPNSKFIYKSNDYSGFLDSKNFSSEWFFVKDDDKEFLNKIKNSSLKLKDLDVSLSSSISTHEDKFYIGTIKKTDKIGIVEFTNKYSTFEIEEKILSKIVKSSKLEIKENRRLICPYYFREGKYIVIEEEELKTSFPLAYRAFLENKELLLKRSMPKSFRWYEFASRQSLNNDYKLLFKQHFSLNKGIETLIISDKNYKTFGGFEISSSDINKLYEVKEILESPEFFKYAKLVSKDLSSTYSTLTLSNVKDFGIIQEEVLKIAS
jgi:hypothetical protein